MITITDEEYYQSYLAIEELTYGQFPNKSPDDHTRYEIADAFYTKLISRLKLRGSVQIRVIRNYGKSQNEQVYKLSLAGLQKAHQQVVSKALDLETTFVGDNSFKPIFEVIRDMFLESNRVKIDLIN